MMKKKKKEKQDATCLKNTRGGSNQEKGDYSVINPNCLWISLHVENIRNQAKIRFLR